MKRLLPLLLAMPFAAAAQKIKSSGYDAAKQWRIETLPVNLKGSAKAGPEVSLRSVGDSVFLILAGSGANTVLAGDAAIFLLDDNGTVTVKSPTVQLPQRNTYRHEYTAAADDLETLSRRSLQALRKYSTDGYDDIYIEAQYAAKLRDLFLLFLAELKKANVVKAKSSAVPGFPGGKEVLLRFLNRNLKPVAGLQNGERKFMTAEFRVAADGSVDDLLVKHSAGDAVDKEALRILKRMPKWKPAMENGKTTDVTVMQPMTFVKEEKGLVIRF